jgi:acyl carrier protein
MNQAEFLKSIADAIDYDGILLPDQDVDTLNEWDSLGVLSVLVFLSEIGLQVDSTRLASIVNISELLEISKSVLAEN